jgi:hypothetical protein
MEYRKMIEQSKSKKRGENYEIGENGEKRWIIIREKKTRAKIRKREEIR